MTDTSRPRALLAGLGLLAAALLLACSGDDDPAAAAATAEASPAAATTTEGTSRPAATGTATATPQASPAASSGLQRPPALQLPRFSEPDAARAFADLRTLAVEIGPRAAGTAAERRAAEFIAGQFEAAGYDATLEEFEATFTSDDSAVAASGEGPPLSASALSGSPNGEATARLVFAGLGEPAELAAAGVEDAIALLDRGILTFADKADNAQAAGAVGVVIVNNERGLFRGALGDRPGLVIPVVGVAGEAGAALRALAEGGTPVTVRADLARRAATSQNVVARLGDAECRAYLGAHYDSVPQGPGANDNASGTALLIELARSNLVEGLCYIAFGSEEVGLFGSRAYVSDHDVTAADWMLNFDMVARIGRPTFIQGDAALAQRGSDLAAALGHTIPPGRFPVNASSDHASFSQVGVPAITVTSGGADFIHTPQDAIATVSSEDLAVLLDVATALLRDLLEPDEVHAR